VQDDELDPVARTAAAVSTADPVAADRVLHSDPHDFAGLYLRHHWSFTLHARRYLHDARDADEVVQEAFLRLFLALPELETELQALAYCRRTITNLCIDRYRAQARRPRLVDLESVPVEDLADDDPGDPVVRAEDAAIVRDALSMLSPLHRAALVKREIEEKPLPVIAEELEIAEDSVKHVLFRARRSLRRLLAATSLAPGRDAEGDSGLGIARAGSGGLAALLMLFVVGVGSGPNLSVLPVVGSDLPDLPGVTEIARAVGEAVTDVSRAVTSSVTSSDDPGAGADQPSGPGGGEQAPLGDGTSPNTSPNTSPELPRGGERASTTRAEVPVPGTRQDDAVTQQEAVREAPRAVPSAPSPTDDVVDELESEPLPVEAPAVVPEVDEATTAPPPPVASGPGGSRTRAPGAPPAPQPPNKSGGLAPTGTSSGADGRQDKPAVAERRQDKPAVAERRQEKPAVAERRQEKPAVAERRQEKPAVAERRQEKLAVAERRQEKLAVVDRTPRAATTPPGRSTVGKGKVKVARVQPQQAASVAPGVQAPAVEVP